MKKQIDDLKVGNFVVLTLRNGQEVTGRITYIDYNLKMADLKAFEGTTYIIDNADTFELWQDRIEDKTESVSESKGLSGFTVDKELLEKAKEKGIDELRRNILQSNDLQQRKRNDTVNHPSHYNYGDIEIIDFIEQVTKHYNPNVAYHIGNAIKYIARSPHKNGKEDVEKAKWYIERAYENWDK